MTARYGDFVLLRPPVEPATWGLWFGPALVLVIAAAGLVVYCGLDPGGRTTDRRIWIPKSAAGSTRCCGRSSATPGS